MTDSKPRTFQVETEAKALAILTDLSHAPMTIDEITAKYGISRNSWRTTYKAAVRQAARQVGMYVPRPVHNDGFAYRAIDQWNDDGKEPGPAIENGFITKLQDEYTRVCNTREHVRAAMKGAVRANKTTLSQALSRLVDLETGVLAMMETVGETAGVSLKKPDFMMNGELADA